MGTGIPLFHQSTGETRLLLACFVSVLMHTGLSTRWDGFVLFSVTSTARSALFHWSLLLVYIGLRVPRHPLLMYPI